MTTQEEFAHYLEQAVEIETHDPSLYPFIIIFLDERGWVEFDWRRDDIEYSWTVGYKPMDNNFTYGEAVQMIKDKQGE